MIGTTIGRYRVTKPLGEGGMGSVWLAEDPVLGRSVAIKLLPERMADSPEAKERLLREARAACKLHHSGIATVYEAGEDGGRVWVAFEHVDGETVAQRVKREGPLPVEEAIRIARGAAEALGHAHTNGVLHRDVTSGNLMIDRKGRVKLVDFGLAVPEEQSRKTRTMSTPATIGYVAPEVVQGESGNRRADLYGLGVVLYEMLTGHLPFERDRAEAVLYAVVNEEPVPPREHRPHLPVDLEAIVLRAIARDPAQRFTDAAELIRALKAGAVSVTRDRRSEPKCGIRWRRLGWVALGVLVVAAAWSFIPCVIPCSPSGFDSVAVLPLSLPGDNAEEIAYLATGLGDALAGKLARVSDLRVTPWVTSRRYSPDELPLTVIGEELNVRSLVAGSFREDAGELRITLSLVHAATGETVWSANFEDVRSGLLELQDIISLAVASGLRGRLTPEEEETLTHRPTDRFDAYDQYLRGAAALDLPGIEAKKLALAYFETALAMDPRLAAAHVGVGAVHTNARYVGWGGNESAILAEESFHRALAIDPDMIPATRGLTLLSFVTGRNERCLRIARDLRERSGSEGQVSVEALLAQAEGYLLGGLPEEALPLLDVVTRLDPANGAAHWYTPVAYSWSGDRGRAIQAGEDFLRTFGEDAQTHYILMWDHWCAGNRSAALDHLERARQLWGDGAYPHFYAEAAIFYRASGVEDRALEIAREGIRRLEPLAASPDSPLETHLIQLHAVLGDTTRVLERGRRLLERAPWRSPDQSPDIGPFALAHAFASIGDEEDASRVLLEMTDLLAESGASRGTPGEETSGGAGVYFFSGWLTECGEPGSSQSTNRLAAYPGFMKALRAEQERLRELYGS